MNTAPISKKSACGSGWLFSLGLGAVVASLSALELAARRGWQLNPYLLNKVVASTGLILIAAALSWVTLTRLFARLGDRRGYARSLGVVGVGWATLHVVMTLLVADPARAGAAKFAFPGFLFDHPTSIVLALVGLVSFLMMLRARDRKRLKTLGRIGLGSVLGHSAMLKVGGWGRWWETMNPVLPPLSLLVTLLVALLIGYKLVHRFHRSASPARTAANQGAAG